MPRSLRVRQDCIPQVKLAVNRNGFPSQKALALELGISKNTVSTFLNGKNVDYLNFVEICEKLSLDWKNIADLGNFNSGMPQDKQDALPIKQTVFATVEIDKGRQDVHSTISQSSEKRVILQQSTPSVPVWIGRVELLDKLKAKLLEPGTPLKILALIGQGGIGKTSLAIKLLEAIGADFLTKTLATDSHYDCVMYFKAGEGTSFDEVAEVLLKGLGIETAEPLKDARQKINQIIFGLGKQQCLVLLDNLESILHPASHPQVGRAISADWGELLNALAYQQHGSQAILTSREVPADLADLRSNQSTNRKLVYIETLTGISTEAGTQILQDYKFQDTPEDLKWIAERVKGHPLILNLLSGYAELPGYLRKHPELVTDQAQRIVRQQLVRQSEAALNLLKKMCLLRLQIDIQGLTFLRLYTNDVERDERFIRATQLRIPAEFTEKEISETKAIVNRLVDSSLVQKHYEQQKCELVYDLHQVILECMQAEYKEELPKLAITAYCFYCAGVKNVENLQNFNELQAVLEAQFFAFVMGDYRRSAKILIWLIDEHLRRWGHWNLLKDLYEHILYHVEEYEHLMCLINIGRIYLDFGNIDLAKNYFNQALILSKIQTNNYVLELAVGYLKTIDKLEIFEGKINTYYSSKKESNQALEQLNKVLNNNNYSFEKVLFFLKHESKFDKIVKELVELLKDIDNKIEELENILNNVEENEKIEYKQALNELEQKQQELRQILDELNQGKQKLEQNLEELAQAKQKTGQSLDEHEQVIIQFLQKSEECHDIYGFTSAIGKLGRVELDRGHLEIAEKLLTEALEKMEALGMNKEIAETKFTLALLELRRGNKELAQQNYDIACQNFKELGAAKDLNIIESLWEMEKDREWINSFRATWINQLI